MRRPNFRRAALERLVRAQRTPRPTARVCCVCGAHIGGADPAEPGVQISHGYCGACAEKAKRQGGIT